MENEANTANVDELDAHIKRIGTKLAGMPRGTEQYAETKELLEDYYERLLQIRTMTIDTLHARLEETEREASQVIRQYHQSSRALTCMAALLSVLVGYTVEQGYDGLVSGPLCALADLVYESTAALVGLTAIGVHMLTRWGWKRDASAQYTRLQSAT